MNGYEKLIRLVADTSSLVASANPISTQGGIVDEYAVPAEALVKVLQDLEALVVFPAVVVGEEKVVVVN